MIMKLLCTLHAINAQITLHSSGYGCASQTKNLGEYTSVDLCAAAALPDPSCPGDEIMFSITYPEWDCRCCAISTTYNTNANWDIYKYNVVVSVADYECGQQYKNLGNIATATECAAIALADPVCIGNEIMHSSYAPSWGCRCCQIGSTYIAQPNWDVYMFPTPSPTNFPTLRPTGNPTQNPTTTPSNNPTKNPTLNPTKNPTDNPTSTPSQNPTKSPTSNTTVYPTTYPTNNPTSNPTNDPSSYPTFYPTINPTLYPTTDPIFNPTMFPTEIPTNVPSTTPSYAPSEGPTVESAGNVDISSTVSIVITEDEDQLDDDSTGTGNMFIIIGFVILIACCFGCLVISLLICLHQRREEGKENIDHNSCVGTDTVENENMGIQMVKVQSFSDVNNMNLYIQNDVNMETTTDTPFGMQHTDINTVDAGEEISSDTDDDDDLGMYNESYQSPGDLNQTPGDLNQTPGETQSKNNMYIV